MKSIICLKHATDRRKPTELSARRRGDSFGKAINGVWKRGLGGSSTRKKASSMLR